MPNIAFLSTAHTHTKGFLKAVSERDDANLVAIWDDMEPRGQGFSEEYGGDYSNNLDAVISRDDVDGFIVCAENSRHLPLLEAAIPTGKPIFCEKPLALSLGEVERAGELCWDQGSKLAVNLFRQFDPSHREVASLVQEGDLGRIQSVHCYYGKGLLHNGSHWLDLLRYLFGEVSWVVGKPTGWAFEDDPTCDVH